MPPNPTELDVATELEHLQLYLATPDDPYLLAASDAEYAAVFADF